MPPTAAPFEPLEPEGLERLAELLRKIGGEKAMDLEMLDGFLCAAIIGPVVVMPSECVAIALGADEPAFEDRGQAEAFFGMFMRHWNTIATTIDASPDVFYEPLMLPEADGAIRGNRWAQGFLRGVDLRRDDWAHFIADEDEGGAMVPIFALAHENDPDPDLRPYSRPMSAEQREALHFHATASLVRIRRHFRAQVAARGRRPPQRRAAPKVGRNDPCPCGSGRKYKNCHGSATLH